MLAFLKAVAEFPFLQTALLSGLLASVACGIVGSYVVVRRISYLAGGIAHCVLGGIGFARYCQVVYGWHWLDPLVGATIAGLLAALVIGIVSLRTREREDTVIGAVWAIGMAVGVLFIFKTPGFGVDPMSYLFGSILMVRPEDLWLLVGLDVAVIGIGLLFYHQFSAVCFDEEFARLRGINVEFYYLLLLCLTAITVVLLVSVVGIVLVIALLTLPVATAGFFCRTLWQTMLGATLLTALLTTLGLALSYAPDLPPGATTIILAGLLYVVVLLASLVLQYARRRLTARSIQSAAVIGLLLMLGGCGLFGTSDFANLPVDPSGYAVEPLARELSASFARGHDVYLATPDGGIFRTDDRDPNASWTSLGSPLTAGARLLFVSSAGTIFASPNKEPLWRSTDGGATWTVVLDVACWRVDEDDGGALYAGNYTKDGVHVATLYKSVDGGATWRESFRRGDCDHIHTVRWDDRAQRLYIAWGDCELRGQGYSDDRGATWTILQAGPGQGHTDVAITRDNILWCSDNATGIVWRVNRADGNAQPYLGRSQYMWIAVSGDEDVYVGTMTSNAAGGERAALLASSDQGATWQKLLESPPSTGAYTEGYIAESRNLSADGWLYLAGTGEGNGQAFRVRRDARNAAAAR